MTAVSTTPLSTAGAASPELKKTPLYDWHAAAGARLVDFAGWSMPVQYSSIIQEHQATRTAVGIFDVSHMGRFVFRDLSALEHLDRLTTRRVADLSAGRIRYSLVCNPAGGILDDVLVYHVPAGPDREAHVMMVVNASNRQKIAAWIRQHAPDAQFDDRTADTAMIAVQGPRALEILQPLCDAQLDEISYYHGVSTRVGGAAALVSRTGYTGEDGCEVIAEARDALALIDDIASRADRVGGRPAGLGARDTLRLEAAMPLYGHELTEHTNAAQCGLNFAINLKDRDFIGKEAIQSAKSNPALAQRVGLELDGRRAAREGAAVLLGDSQVGTVTSGTYSPTLNRPIAMAYVQPAQAGLGNSLQVDIRGTPAAAKVVELPFYKAPK